MNASAAARGTGAETRGKPAGQRVPGWLLPCLGAALGINAVLFFLLPLLTQTRVSPELAGPPVGVSLVRLREPEPPPPEEQDAARPPPEPARPAVADAFQPELLQPRFQELEMPALNLDVDTRILGAPSDVGLKMYYNAEELDQAPQPVAQVRPMYPFRATRMEIEGYVKVRFLVDDQGRVSQVTVLESSPEGMFESSVLKTLPAWRFRPGTITGKPVSSWVETKILFELN